MAIDYNVREEEPDLRSEEDCFPNIDPGVEILGDRVQRRGLRQRALDEAQPGVVVTDGEAGFAVRAEQVVPGGPQGPHALRLQGADGRAVHPFDQA